MVRRIVLSFVLAVGIVMVAVPFLVVFDVVEVEEGTDPLLVIVIPVVVAFMALWMGLIVWAIVRPWLRKSDEPQPPSSIPHTL